MYAHAPLSKTSSKRLSRSPRAEAGAASLKWLREAKWRDGHDDKGRRKGERAALVTLGAASCTRLPTAIVEATGERRKTKAGSASALLMTFPRGQRQPRQLVSLC